MTVSICHPCLTIDPRLQEKNGYFLVASLVARENQFSHFLHRSVQKPTHYHTLIDRTRQIASSSTIPPPPSPSPVVVIRNHFIRALFVTQQHAALFMLFDEEYIMGVSRYESECSMGKDGRYMRKYDDERRR